MRKVLFIAFMALIVSCVKHDTDSAPASKLKIVAEIDPSAVSKAVHDESRFDEGNTLGLFVYHSETERVESPATMTEFVLSGERYRNVLAVHSGEGDNSWMFQYEDALSSFEDMYLLIPSDQVSGLAILAYAPYADDVLSIKEIPFTLGGRSEKMTDLMWAQPGENYKVVPDGSDQKVRLVFRHALSMLKIGFRTSDAKSVKKVTGITVRKKGGGDTPLLASGKFDATDGSINNPAGVQNLKYDYSGESYKFGGSADSYVYVPVLICPQVYKTDGDYELIFEIDGEILDSSYKIRVSDVDGGFQPGMTYTLTFTIDDFVKFDGASVGNVWGELGENENK